ncbi:MAG TPA: 16S rRNA (guanine(527)-N(7))-methyltransferase RsmG [Anaerolineaceae bacterium]|nr:16S rRNA (guanine(527)-N(7))-methyltransferase RsmG [Anaerolineaceae bacterium]HOA21245.1 16S rRNA (guanine(527)-N(7))-methyltransferase RsmG [Anaerolineaceae bacterium]HOG77329.1 16S rRNA (guanine(527)-N(7))-methyltransferase RsmG [Anaerolineaceae bacterium]
METFAQNARQLLGLQLSREQIAAFKLLEDELLEWNSHFNLTAIRDKEGIETKHFLDSLTCLMALDAASTPRSLIDIGTGAGFPGIPLKLILPQMRLTLVESIQKKAGFCTHIVEKLGLRQVQVLAERAEEVGQNPEHRESYDLATARAVAAMPTLVEYLLPLVRIGGLVIMQKGESAQLEALQSEKVIQRLGGKIKVILPVVLPGVVDERYLVVLEKVARTSADFPRRTGLPAKQPLT